MKNEVVYGIKEAYCSFEVSKLLKEKGFNEYCWKLYELVDLDKPVLLNGFELDSDSKFWNNRYLEVYKKEHPHIIYNCSAPSHQMAMAWCREVHKLHIGIVRGPKGYHVTIETIPLGVVKYITREITGTTTYVDSCEEAAEVALRYVLKNLI